jgi:capsular exopolysaccharide synthesis family protein
MSIVEKAIGRAVPERAKVGAAATPVVPAGARVAEAPRLPVVDAAPIAVRACLSLEEFPPLARDFRFLKRPVLARVFGLSRAAAARPGNLVMVTSDLPHAGKSFVSLNLAGSMASEQMTRVLLIDADPVRRTLTSRLGAEDRAGLLDLLANPAMGLGDVMLATDVDSLYFLPAGATRSDATELLASPRLMQMLKSLDDPDLVVLIDSPPLLLTSEGRVLADQVNHALVVVESGRSTENDVGQVLQLLKGTAATVSLVLNKTPVPASARYHDYYYPY